MYHVSGLIVIDIIGLLCKAAAAAAATCRLSSVLSLRLVYCCRLISLT